MNMSRHVEHGDCQPWRLIDWVEFNISGYKMAVMLSGGTEPGLLWTCLSMESTNLGEEGGGSFWTLDPSLILHNNKVQSLTYIKL